MRKELIVHNSLGSALAFMSLGACGCVALAFVLFSGDRVDGTALVIVGPVAALVIPGVFKFIDRRIQLRADFKGVHNPLWPVNLVPWKDIAEIKAIKVEPSKQDAAYSATRNLVCLVLEESSSVIKTEGISTFCIPDERSHALKLDNQHWNVAFDELLETLNKLHALYA